MTKISRVLKHGFMLALMSASVAFAMETTLKSSDINNYASSNNLNDFKKFLDKNEEVFEGKEGLKGSAREVWKLVKTQNLKTATTEEAKKLSTWQTYENDMTSLGAETPTDHQGDGITTYKNPEEYRDKFTDNQAIRLTSWYQTNASLYGGQVKNEKQLFDLFLDDATSAYKAYKEAYSKKVEVENMEYPLFLAAKKKQ